MALVFDQSQNIPQTHVLVIGVGKYPFLKDGDQQREQNFEFLKGLGQLSTPSVSANAFLEQVIDYHQNHSWTVPLGSVDVLMDNPVISNIDGTEVQQDPTFENISASYQSWKLRCDTYEDNVAILYYSGHGFGYPAEQFLLPQDFGSKPFNPWVDAIDFSRTRMAFHACRANTQMIFIDACRSLPIDAFTNELRASPLDTVKKATSECRYNFTLLAAASNERAYGPVNQPSFFTAALISALKGGASERKQQRWEVTTDKIYKVINDLVKDQNHSKNNPQRCTLQGNAPFTISKLNTVPIVSVSMDCDPGLALPHTSFSFTNMETNLTGSRQPEEAPWIVDLEAGVYKLVADFQNGNYVGKTVLEMISPPNHKQIFVWEQN